MEYQPDKPERTGGVQSIGRAFDLIEALSDAGRDMGLSELSEACGLPLPTIHRLLGTLVDRGYVRRLPSRRYALGARLIRIGDSAGRQLGLSARPYLEALAREVGETANMAILDGDDIVYVAQAASRHSMRMFTEVGRRVRPHGTAVGKVLLATLPPDRARALLERTGLPAYTPRTITDVEDLVLRLQGIAERGWALDDGEQEIGVRCVAVPVPGAPAPTAISVSGPAERVTDELLDKAVPALRRAAADMRRALESGDGEG